MVQAPAARFRFDFEDLRPAPLDLRVVGGRPALPQSAVDVPPAARRPGWLPRLLPVFAAGEPLHVEVLGDSSFGGLLLESLVALLATAGAEARVRVLLVDGGFVVGGPQLDTLPARPHVTLVPVDLTPRAVAAAIEDARTRPTPLLVLNGSLPRLDRHLGITGQALVRVPLVGRGELEAVRRGIAPSLLRKAFGLGCLGLARRVVEIYAEGLR